MALAVLVLEGAVEHERQDLRLPVRVRAEAGVRLDPVFVEDAQAPEAHPIGVPVGAKREAVSRVEPAQSGAGPFLAAAESGRMARHGAKRCSTTNLSR